MNKLTITLLAAASLISGSVKAQDFQARTNMENFNRAYQEAQREAQQRQIRELQYQQQQLEAAQQRQRFEQQRRSFSSY
jgi:hypothetical protein